MIEIVLLLNEHPHCNKHSDRQNYIIIYTLAEREEAIQMF